MTADTLAGTGRLVRFMLRRDRVRLSVWIGSLLLLYVYFIVALGSLYRTQEERQTRAALMETPASVIMAGPGYGLDNYTTGAILANEMVLWMIAGLAIMSMSEVVRNTRAEEESGRAELVRAGAVGRHAPAVAALLTVVIANVVFALLSALLLILAGDLAVADSFAVAAGTSLSALVFAAVAVVACQVTEHSRGASGLGLAALGLAVLVRGIGDLQERHGSTLSWFSPIAWTQQMRSYVDLRTWPMALSVGAVVLLLVLGASLASRRDFGAGLTGVAPGRAEASPLLRSPLALAWRQQRTGLFWWFGGFSAMFVASGTYLGDGIEQTLETMAEQNPAVFEMFGTGDLADSFTAILLVFGGVFAAGYGVSAALRAKTEEAEGRTEVMLALPVSRTRWLAAQLTVAVLGATFLMMVGVAFALWRGAVTAGAEADLGHFLGAGAAYVPGLLVVLGLAAALYAWAPRATPVLWALIAFMGVSGMFGSLLDLPDAVLGISPFWWSGMVPLEKVEAAPLVVLSALAVALFAAAFAGFRRRDVPR
ncbi:ABC transporter permease [Antribacter gilvus]|uniref:ABC transporter permease n=1 Tax=Antribacter gilvus TaxID=2304675 RepID=UPI000F79D1C8|nr:hypothetical protein [Antribacter gilvus]